MTGTGRQLYRYLEDADAGSAYSRDGQAWERIQFRAEPATRHLQGVHMCLIDTCGGCCGVS